MEYIGVSKQKINIKGYDLDALKIPNIFLIKII